MAFRQAGAYDQGRGPGDYPDHDEGCREDVVLEYQDITNLKFEARRSKQYQKSKQSKSQTDGLNHLNLPIRICFVFRNSDFGFKAHDVLMRDMWFISSVCGYF